MHFNFGMQKLIKILNGESSEKKSRIKLKTDDLLGESLTMYRRRRKTDLIIRESK